MSTVIVTSGEHIDLLGKRIVSLMAWNRATGAQMAMIPYQVWGVRIVNPAGEILFDDYAIMTAQFSLRRLRPVVAAGPVFFEQISGTDAICVVMERYVP